ncbi:MAG: hypothetical protein MZV49_26055 [Rhodopseudomonas palustris]|nr:hypothetical protein [Rhodopseudomonas palustris]
MPAIDARRAAAAMAGIYGNDAVEALYPMLATDSEGKKLGYWGQQLRADLRQGRHAAAGQGVLVGDHVRRQDPAC